MQLFNWIKNLFIKKQLLPRSIILLPPSSMEDAVTKEYLDKNIHIGSSFDEHFKEFLNEEKKAQTQRRPSISSRTRTSRVKSSKPKSSKRTQKKKSWDSSRRTKVSTRVHSRSRKAKG